ncbi:unnamed protein product [Arabidopsis lyrata]|nr:unnamed protein product [Arabidopsis lyrata]
MKEMKMDWRRAALRHLKDERVRKFEYCLPYFYDPFKEDELEQSSEVQILYPSEPPVVCEFDWSEARCKVIEEVSQDDRQAFQSIKFYKLYPQPPPDISGLKKLPIINRYYGNAHQVF